MDKGWCDIETSPSIPSPGRSLVGRVVGNDQLSCRVDGVGGKVQGSAMNAMPGRDGVEGKEAKMVESKLSEV